MANHSWTHTWVLVPAIDVEHTLECALVAGSLFIDPTQHAIHSLIVSAIQLACRENPHGECNYSWCGVKHDPLCRCICFGKSVIGLPPHVPIPTNSSCPICLKEKQPLLPKDHQGIST